MTSETNAYLLSDENNNFDDNKSSLELDNLDLSNNLLLNMLNKAVTFPGVRVNRASFLMEIYSLSGTEIDTKDISEIVSLEQMDIAAQKVITKTVTSSSGTAFVLGLPGGIAMAATIPADVMQNFAFSLRLAQQLAYVYGFDDLFGECNGLNDNSQNTLIVFLGIMFAATGSGTVLRAMAPNIGKYAAKQTLKKPLTKTVWYPMLKKIANVVASKTVTKKGLSEFASKAIPVIGGAVSAGINVATMIPMANRLKNELRKYYLFDEEICELEEKEQATFVEKTSDFISDVAVGSIKTVEKTKRIGKLLGEFANEISTKTKSKIYNNSND